MRDNRGDKETRTLEGTEAYGPTENCKHNLTPSQKNISPLTKGLFTSVSFYPMHRVYLSEKKEKKKKTC